MRKVRRAAAVANFNGWAVAIGAGITLLCGLTSLSSLILAGALGLAAAMEFRGRAMLRRLDSGAPRHLAINQIFLGAAIALYCAWTISLALRGQGSLALASAGDPAVDEMLAPFQSMIMSATVIAYGSAIALTLFIQGAAAWYYLSRRRHVEAFKAQTPAWIVDAYRSGALGS